MVQDAAGSLARLGVGVKEGGCIGGVDDANSGRRDQASLLMESNDARLQVVNAQAVDGADVGLALNGLSIRQGGGPTQRCPRP